MAAMMSILLAPAASICASLSKNYGPPGGMAGGMAAVEDRIYKRNGTAGCAVSQSDSSLFSEATCPSRSNAVPCAIFSSVQPHKRFGERKCVLCQHFFSAGRSVCPVSYRPGATCSGYLNGPAQSIAGARTEKSLGQGLQNRSPTNCAFWPLRASIAASQQLQINGRMIMNGITHDPAPLTVRSEQAM